ncbi:EamA family transporter [uncultured Megasphaera sp.]|uniref:DMT family transporter n=1 Tax=uncultured Megasphaera sp. TaxID=165188 RepID=UPI0028062357|nr:EamA family transporter [uncultured Megasphaera sp.]
MLRVLFLIYAIWGFNWVVMKEANLFFPPVTFSAWRFTVGALVLFLFNAWLHLPVPPRRYWPWIVVTGILQIAFNNAAIQVGMVSLGAGLVAVLNYSMPVWMALLAHFFLGEHLTRRKVLGIAVSMVGMCLLMNVGSGGDVGSILLTLSGAVAWAAAGIIIKIQDRRMKKKDCSLIQYTTWQMVVGAAALWIYTAVTGTGTVQWTAMAAGCLLYNGVLASALVFFLWNYLLTRIEAAKAGIAVLGVPVVGVLCGVLFLHEALTLVSAAGMIMILAGIVCIVRKGA